MTSINLISLPSGLSDPVSERPEEIIARNDQNRDVREALSRLSETERDAVIAKRGIGRWKSASELARELGVKKSVVWAWAISGERKLRENLAFLFDD